MYQGFKIFKLPGNILAIIIAICTLITNISDFGTAAQTPQLELVKTDKLVATEALNAGQGVTTDGEYYYTSGSVTALGISTIAKWKADTFEKVKVNFNAIPADLRNNYGSDHIGGIGYANGLIYAAVENKSEDYPLVITYDPETLKPVNIYEMPAEMLPDGIPWCCVDAENGYLYCSPFHNVNGILVFNLETLQYDHTIELSKQITRIQGGDVYDGILYLSYDIQSSNTDEIYKVDLETGKVTDFASRYLPTLAGNEAEDLAVYPMADGSFIHVLDYDKTVGVYLRHYKVADAYKD